MTEELYLNYCVYKNDDKEVLGYVSGDLDTSFVADAWKEDEMNEVDLTKNKDIAIVTVDDACSRIVEVSNIRRLTSDDEYYRFMEDVSPFFDVFVEMTKTRAGSNPRHLHVITIEHPTIFEDVIKLRYGAKYMEGQTRPVISEEEEEITFLDLMLMLDDACSREDTNLANHAKIKVLKRLFKDDSINLLTYPIKDN